MEVNRNLASSSKNYVRLADIEESNEEIVSCKEQVDILKKRLMEANNDIQIQVRSCVLVLLTARRPSSRSLSTYQYISCCICILCQKNLNSVSGVVVLQRTKCLPWADWCQQLVQSFVNLARTNVWTLDQCPSSRTSWFKDPVSGQTEQQLSGCRQFSGGLQSSPWLLFLLFKYFL